MQGVKEGGGRGGGGGFGDIFDMFGMGGQGGSREKKQQKGKPIGKEMKITLEDAYSGKMNKVNHTRKKLCEGCDGKGGAN